MKHLTIVKPAILACSAGLLLTACHTERHERHHPDYSSTSGQSYQDDSWMRGSGAQTSSSQEYSSSSQNYSDSSAQAQIGDQASSQSSQSLQGQNEIVIPLHEEQLNVGKRTVDAGQVTIRKIVKTETVSEPVQLRREMLVINRDSAGAQSGASFSSTEHDANWQKGTANLDQSEQPASASETERDISARASADQSSADEPAGASRQSASSDSDLSSGTAFQEQTYTIRLQREEPVIQKNVIQTGRVVARKNSQSQQQTIQQQVRSEDVQLDKSGANVEIRGNFESAGKQISEPSGAERHDQIQNQSESQSLKSQSEAIQRDSSGAQQPDTGVDKATDSTTRNRAPTQGQGAQDLKQQSLDRDNP